MTSSPGSQPQQLAPEDLLNQDHLDNVQVTSREVSQAIARNLETTVKSAKQSHGTSKPLSTIKLALPDRVERRQREIAWIPAGVAHFSGTSGPSCEAPAKSHQGSGWWCSRRSAPGSARAAQQTQSAARGEPASVSQARSALLRAVEGVGRLRTAPT